MDDKLKLAGQAYGKGFTCSQAVFCAYARDMGIDETTACRIMEGFGGGFGGMQEVCGALAAATAIISFYSSEGTPGNGEKRKKVYEKYAGQQKFFKRNMAASPAGRFCMENAQKHFSVG